MSKATRLWDIPTNNAHVDLDDEWPRTAAGMQVVREQLEANAHPRFLRMMVLMTDGLALQSDCWPEQAKQHALREADLAAASKIRVVTISLGAGADKDLMQVIEKRRP